MIKVFNYYSDPGHGWIKVPISLLEGLGIAGKVSRYSYMRKGFGYLEEDCDASLFFNAYRLKFGFDPIIREQVAREKRSKIRSYDTFNTIKGA